MVYVHLRKSLQNGNIKVKRIFVINRQTKTGSIQDYSFDRLAC